MSESDQKTLHIKNMVCPRCIESVQQILNELNISSHHLALGEVSLAGKIDVQQKEKLSEKLRTKGFELIEDHKSRIISQLKSKIIVWVNENKTHLNLSDFLADELNTEYSSLSKLFSEVEGITLERYAMKIKVEKIKELLFYDDLTLSQVADQLNYSSVAYLSSLFKKETGMTPSHFKKLKKPGHGFLNEIS